MHWPSFGDRDRKMRSSYADGDRDLVVKSRCNWSLQLLFIMGKPGFFWGLCTQLRRRCRGNQTQSTFFPPKESQLMKSKIRSHWGYQQHSSLSLFHFQRTARQVLLYYISGWKWPSPLASKAAEVDGGICSSSRGHQNWKWGMWLSFFFGGGGKRKKERGRAWWNEAQYQLSRSSACSQSSFFIQKCQSVRWNGEHLPATATTVCQCEVSLPNPEGIHMFQLLPIFSELIKLKCF